jgi:hypothetical protein
MCGLPVLTVAMALKTNQPPSSVLFVAALNSPDFALGLSRSLAHSPTQLPSGAPWGHRVLRSLLEWREASTVRDLGSLFR